MKNIISVIVLVLVVIAVAFCAIAFLPKDTVGKVNNWGNGKIEQITNNPNNNDENTDGTEAGSGEISGLPLPNEGIRTVEQIIIEIGGTND